jgi:hypothetical protein
MSRDQHIHEMALAASALTSSSVEVEAPSAPIEIVTNLPTSSIAESSSTESSTVESSTAVESIEEVAKTRRLKRKASDYLVEGDVIKHTATELVFIYTGDAFVTEDGAAYNSLSDIVKKHKVSKSARNGFEACEVQRGSTWIKISELEKHAE